MKVRAAVVFAANERWRIVEVELRALREGGAGPHAGGGPLRDLRNI